MTFEGRHVVGLFLGVVVLCGVFFTLGYVMGRTQSDSSVRAASPSNKLKLAPESTPRPPETTAPALPGPTEWDFYHAGETRKPEDRLAGQGSAKSAASAPPATSAQSSKATPAKSLVNAPLIPGGAYVLQVAALTRTSDALALAEALQQKKFPAFVLTPKADNLYRVQVGPYADAQSASLARQALEREGFKAIIKR